MSDSAPRLTVGWRYSVQSQGVGDDAVETLGRFRGYTALGQESALAIEVDEGEGAGRLRIIPIANVLWMELLEGGDPQEPEPSNSVYFG